MSDVILTLNAGSSSIKFSTFVVNNGKLAPVFKGQVESIGSNPHFEAKGNTSELIAEDSWQETNDGSPHTQAIEKILGWMNRQTSGDNILAVGHRIVHGGDESCTAKVIDEHELDRIRSLIPLVPLHQPINVNAVEVVSKATKDAIQVACFDTAFHQTRAPLSQQFALPAKFLNEGVKRYGFHGISYDYITSQLDKLEQGLSSKRTVVAHLGSGSSMSAVQHGKCVDTTMGFSSLDGVPMSTRCGSIDPGVLLYMMREHGMGVEQIEDVLYKQSGLLGLSGVSSDLREIRASSEPAAATAVEYLIYKIGQTIASLAASMHGLDALIFTAGIGENDAKLRAQVCERAAWMGIEIDKDANASGKLCISLPSSAVSIWVVPTDEELMIARHTLEAIQTYAATDSRVSCYVENNILQ